MKFNDQYSKWKGWNEEALQKDSVLDSYFFEILNLSSRFSDGLNVLEIGFGDADFLYSGGDIYPVRFGPFYERLANLFFLFLRNLLDIFFSLFLKKKPIFSYFSCNPIVVFSHSKG